MPLNKFVIAWLRYIDRDFEYVDMWVCWIFILLATWYSTTFWTIVHGNTSLTWFVLTTMSKCVNNIFFCFLLTIKFHILSFCKEDKFYKKVVVWSLSTQHVLYFSSYLSFRVLSGSCSYNEAFLVPMRDTFTRSQIYMQDIRSDKTYAQRKIAFLLSEDQSYTSSTTPSDHNRLNVIGWNALLIIWLEFQQEVFFRPIVWPHLPRPSREKRKKKKSDFITLTPLLVITSLIKWNTRFSANHHMISCMFVPTYEGTPLIMMVV